MQFYPLFNMSRKRGFCYFNEHLGRPKGQVLERMRLEPVAKALEKELQQPVKYFKSTTGLALERKWIIFYPVR